ncbi:MAG: c-type cytochrome [Thiofilum sp.]|uniref:c-type cytochrome n=1 Tax=Thiofilum sp. TaxID=2212733 RepID=UPI0025E8167E|nr:c-type cytochrome [Thiofilum sp.]MBK8451792.1 cytochrome c4 [Thiofilum sp.]
MRGLLQSSIGLVLSMGLLLCAQAADQPLNRTALIAQNCMSCHGTNGISNGPAIPSIAGFSRSYLERSLLEYKTDKRHSTIMGRITKGYSAEDLKLLADYFAQQPFIRASQVTDPHLVMQGKSLHRQHCAVCHIQNGTVDKTGAAILAGQWKTYLQFALTDFQQGARTSPRGMTKSVEAVEQRYGEEGFKALIEFYASQPE